MKDKIRGFIVVAVILLVLWGLFGLIHGEGFIGGITEQFDALGQILMFLFFAAIIIGVIWLIRSKDDDTETQSITVEENPVASNYSYQKSESKKISTVNDLYRADNGVMTKNIVDSLSSEMSKEKAESLESLIADLDLSIDKVIENYNEENIKYCLELLIKIFDGYPELRQKLREVTKGLLKSLRDLKVGSLRLVLLVEGLMDAENYMTEHDDLMALSRLYDLYSHETMPSFIWNSVLKLRSKLQKNSISKLSDKNEEFPLLAELRDKVFRSIQSGKYGHAEYNIKQIFLFYPKHIDEYKESGIMRQVEQGKLNENLMEFDDY